MAIYPYSFTLPPVNKQDIPSDGVVGEFLGISAGGVLDWLPVSGGSGTGDLLAANNLSELTPTAGTARTNLGLGTSDSPTFANLTLTSPSLSSSAPVTISQTWNDLPTAFTALKVNATSTNSALASKLLDLQLGGVSQTSFTKSGGLRFYTTGQFSGGNGFGFANSGFYSISSNGMFVVESGTPRFEFGLQRFCLDPTTVLGWGTIGTTPDTILLRDGAANTLALRNGTAAQTFNVYGTYTSGSVYERMFMRYSGTALAFQVGAETVGATARPLEFLTAGTKKLVLTATGNNTATIYSAANITANILTLRNLSETAKFEFNLNASGNAGLYVGTNTLISEVGNSYFNGGNVGIGTTAPSTLLEVALPASGNTLGQGIKVSRGTGYISLENGTSNISGFTALFTGKGTISGQTFALGFRGLSGSDVDTTNPTVYFVAGNTTYTGPVGDSQVAFRFSNFASPLITALGSGNVGIGTTAPAVKLDVAGDAAARGFLYLDRTGGNLTQMLYLRARNAGNSSAFGNATGFGGGEILTTGLSGLAIGTVDSTPIVLGTGNLERVRIDSVGNVGIGTTSPTSKLHVAGTIKPEQATMVDKAAGFTLAAVDAGTVINSTSATAITINLPAADTAAGYNVMIIQSGAGAVTIAANGNTLNSFGSAFTTAGQHAACSIVRTAASTYNLSGNLV